MKIVIATGGSGGHIFPALETAAVLRDRGHEVIFIGALGLGEEKVRALGFEAMILGAKGLTSRSLTGLLKFSFLMLAAIGQSIRALRRYQPDKVLGFGGYGSFAVVLSARLLNIPTMIHEQNVVPGKANRLLAQWVKKIAISFPETKNYLKAKETVWTGCPCHQSKVAISRDVLLQKFSLDPNRKTIVVLGGSQGSQKINEIFFEMISSWSKENHWQAIHMTGKKEYSLYLKRYQNSSWPVRVVEFISPIEEVYAIADLVIARAGAATVCELGFFAIPSILIPYPLADGHQMYNANILSSLGLASIVEQKELTSEGLNKMVEGFLSAGFDREAWQKKTRGSFKDFPAQELAGAIENL